MELSAEYLCSSRCPISTHLRPVKDLEWLVKAVATAAQSVSFISANSKLKTQNEE